MLVQRLVRADASGVVFSANPVTGARDEIVVNAAFGLGESVVSGTVTPDAIVLGRDDLAVRDHAVADKRAMTVAVAGRRHARGAGPRPPAHAAPPSTRRRRAPRRASPPPSSARRGGPVDLEVAWAGADLFLLQCRPITTLPTHRSTP